MLLLFFVAFFFFLNSHNDIVPSDTCSWHAASKDSRIMGYILPLLENTEGEV